MVPDPQLAGAITHACSPMLDPVLQRQPAAAAVNDAVLRTGNDRMVLLLQARQALAVCLRCWQCAGWWPDAAGALLGCYPSASPVLDSLALSEAQARREVRRLTAWLRVWPAGGAHRRAARVCCHSTSLMRSHRRAPTG
jgi:hypothetical protein